MIHQPSHSTATFSLTPFGFFQNCTVGLPGQSTEAPPSLWRCRDTRCNLFRFQALLQCQPHRCVCVCFVCVFCVCLCVEQVCCVCLRRVLAKPFDCNVHVRALQTAKRDEVCWQEGMHRHQIQIECIVNSHSLTNQPPSLPSTPDDIPPSFCFPPKQNTANRRV